MKWYLLFLAGFFLVTYTYASPSPLPANGSFAALGRVQYFVDSSGRMTLTTVLHQPYRFLTIQENIPHFGQNQPPHWLRFRVENRYSVAHTYIIEVDYAFLLSAQFLNHIMVWQIYSNGLLIVADNV